MQSLRRSVKESIYNIVWGLIGAVVLNYLYLVWRGYEPHLLDMGGLAIVMTIYSFCRSLTIRRWMNRHDGEGR